MGNDGGIRTLVKRNKLARALVYSPALAAIHTVQSLQERLRADPKSADPKIRAFINERSRQHAKGFHVVQLNDIGFQYGAGIAQRRQAASFLLNGWTVDAVSWTGSSHRFNSFTGIKDLDRRIRVDHLRHVHPDKGMADETISTQVVAKVLSLAPDLVIVGSLHGAGWPIDIVSRLRSRGTRAVAYMHDCYWITGRCAYPGACSLYATGCDATCPTASEYPPLPPERIAPAWKEKSEIFSGSNPVPLIANSTWTRDMAHRRFGPAASIALIHPGLDHEVFTPLPQRDMRELLGLPADKTVIAMGAAHINDQWKGGQLFADLHRALAARNDVALVIVGKESENLQSARSFGLVQDERIMPLIYASADMFVSTGTQEAFGQMLLEASACGRPVVAFDVGGVRDVVADGETGLLVGHQSVSDLLAAVDRLSSDKDLRLRMGQSGRSHVESGFTLQHQASAWREYAAGLARLHCPA